VLIVKFQLIITILYITEIFKLKEKNINITEKNNDKFKLMKIIMLIVIVIIDIYRL